MELLAVTKTWLEKVREDLKVESKAKPGFFGRLLERSKQVPTVEVDDQSFLQDCCLEQYRFGELLGVGTMGLVFALTNLDDEAGPPLAVKVLPRPKHEQAGETDAVLFAREVEIGQNLRHPSVVSTFEVLETENARFLVMERVSGQTLQGLMDTHSLDPVRVGSIFGSLAVGLQHAHDGGVVHRDLKPDNVMITDQGQTKILDFGLAQLKGGDSYGSSEVTVTGQFKGTPLYTSPEQIKSSRNVTPACDQFSFGFMLYQALSGQFPYDFDPKQPMQALFVRLQQPPKPLSERRPQTSPALDKALSKMLSIEPEDRFESVSAAFDAVRGELGSS